MSRKKATTIEDKYQKVDGMLAVMEEEGESFFEILKMFFLTFISGTFLISMFEIPYLKIYNIKSYDVLWFNLIEGDQYYVIPLCFIFLAFVIPSIKIIFNIKNKKDEFEHVSLIFSFMISISSSLLLVNSTFNNVISGIFLISIYLSLYLKDLKGVIIKWINYWKKLEHMS